MKHIAKAVVAVGLVSLGMAGLHFKIEYSGWVLFVGLVYALYAD